MDWKRLLLAAALLVFGAAVYSRPTQADEWGNYYYWGYHRVRPQYWSASPYERIYDYRYRYPREKRIFSVQPLWRSWYMKQILWWKFPQHRRFHSGYHFVLDVL